MNINLHIERLVLDGIDLPTNQQDRLRAALEAELGRLLSAGGVRQDLAQGATWPLLPAGDIRLTQGVEASELGQQVARAAYRGIGK